MTKKITSLFIFFLLLIGYPTNNIFAERLIANPTVYTVDNAPHSAKPKTRSKKIVKRNLKLGMTGNDVLVLQKFLIKKSTGPAAMALAKHKANGRFGQLTQDALKEFQKSKGLIADGIAGSKIRKSYNI